MRASEDPDPILLSGRGFVEEARVRWNGAERPTTFQGPERLTVDLGPEDVAEVGTGELIVENPEPGGGLSPGIELVIGNPDPVLDSMAPTSAEALASSGFWLNLHGSRFASGSEGARVLWDGIALPTVVVSSSELRARVSDQLLRDGRSVEVLVANSPPGGGSSATLDFQVRNPVPTLDGARPDSLTRQTEATVVLTGSRFVAGSTVSYDGVELAPVLVRDTVLSLSVPGNLNTRPSVRIRVQNPEPGGGASAEIEIPVRELPPRLTWLSPHAANAGSTGFTMTVSGADFAPDAQVTWNGDPRPTTSLDEGAMEVTVDAADIAEADTVEVVVVNPRGGGESPPRDVVVFPQDFPLPDGRIVTPHFTSDLDGSGRTDLDLHAQNTWHLDAAPVGPSFLYTRDDPWPERRIFEFDPTTATERRITGPEHDTILKAEFWPRYSPNGAWIYFQGYRVDDTEPGIWRIRPDGSGLEELVAGGPPGAEYPAPSNDGTRLAYAVDGALHILDLTTRTSTPLGVGGIVPRWLPDDQRIAFFRLGSLYHVVGVDGTGERQLIAVGGGGSVEYDLSPDGRFLIGNLGDYGLTIIDVETGEWHPLSWFGWSQAVGWYENP